MAVQGGRIPRQSRGEERRDRILRATLAVLGRDGITGVTHRRVADEAGVPLGSLTYWFATKDDLLREALMLFVEEEVTRLRELGEQMSGADVTPRQIAERFSAAIEAEEHRAEQVAQYELYVEAARNPALRDPAAACYKAYEEVAANALRAAGIPDPEGSAPLFVALSDGLALRRVSAPGTAPALEQGLVGLFRGLTSKQNGG
jgi:DNA-binding transcriptional regulator YbjK